MSPFMSKSFIISIFGLDSVISERRGSKSVLDLSKTIFCVYLFCKLVVSTKRSYDDFRFFLCHGFLFLYCWCEIVFIIIKIVNISLTK